MPLLYQCRYIIKLELTHRKLASLALSNGNQISWAATVKPRLFNLYKNQSVKTRARGIRGVPCRPGWRPFQALCWVKQVTCDSFIFSRVASIFSSNSLQKKQIQRISVFPKMSNYCLNRIKEDVSFSLVELPTTTLRTRVQHFFFPNGSKFLMVFCVRAWTVKGEKNK